MNSRQAFDTLLAGIKVALEKNLARQEAAARRGDLDTVEIEREWQENLVNAGNQLQVLQTLWPELVGERKQVAQKPTGTTFWGKFKWLLLASAGLLLLLCLLLACGLVAWLLVR